MHGSVGIALPYSSLRSSISLTSSSFIACFLTLRSSQEIQRVRIREEYIRREIQGPDGADLVAGASGFDKERLGFGNVVEFAAAIRR